MTGALGTLPVTLAHAGPGSTWQAMVVVVSLGLALCVALATAGVLRMERPDDLVLPLAACAIAASLGTLADDWLSDWIGWAIPVGVAALAALLTAAFGPIELELRSPLPYATTALAAAGVWLFWQPLTMALHPPPELLPLSDDSEVTIVVPADGDTVPAGEVRVAVEVSGGSIGPGDVPLEELPADPEEAGGLTVTLGDRRLEVVYDQTCTVDDPCTEVTFPVEVDPGEQRLTVEFTRGDGIPLAPFVADRVTFTAE